MKFDVMSKMKKEAEVEYQLLLSSLGTRKFPDPDFLEIFSYKCDNQWFRTTDFRMLLIDYRLHTYPRWLKRHLDTLRIERYHANAKRKRERVKRKYVRKNSIPVPEPIVEQPQETTIIFNVKIAENLE